MQHRVNKYLNHSSFIIFYLNVTNITTESQRHIIIVQKEKNIKRHKVNIFVESLHSVLTTTDREKFDAALRFGKVYWNILYLWCSLSQKVYCFGWTCERGRWRRGRVWGGGPGWTTTLSWPSPVPRICSSNFEYTIQFIQKKGIILNSQLYSYQRLYRSI